MREKVCNLLAPENESQCQKVAEVSQSVRLELRLDLEPAPVPVTRLPVPLNHYYIYGLASICDNANRRPKKTNLLRATTTCNLKIDAWSQQLQDKALTRAKIMKTETSPIINSLIQFFVIIFKAIFYRNKQIPKKQLEYLFYTGVRRFSILVVGEGGGVSLCIDRFIWGGGGVIGDTMHFKIIGGGGLALAAPRSYAYVLLVVSADTCHIHMCTIFIHWWLFIIKIRS